MASHERFRSIDIDRERLFEANRNMIETINRTGLFLVYDDQLDTLFIDVGTHRDGLLEPFVDNISVRVDPETLEIMGYEIEDFRSDFLPNNRLFKGLVEDLRLFERANELINASESKQKETLQRLVAVG